MAMGAQVQCATPAPARTTPGQREASRGFGHAGCCRDSVRRQRSVAIPPPHEPAIPQRAGEHRCRLIREQVVELLQKRRRHLLRSLRGEPGTFAADESLVSGFPAAPVRSIAAELAAGRYRFCKGDWVE